MTPTATRAPGTLTNTIRMGGDGFAVRHELPVQIRPGGLQQFAFTDVPVPPTPYDRPWSGMHLAEYINNAPDEATLQDVQNTVIRIIASIEFIGNALPDVLWAETETIPSSIPGSCGHRIGHPQGWQVQELAGVVVVYGPPDDRFWAGPVEIVIENVDETTWDSGSYVLGWRHVRRLTAPERVEGNLIRTEYVTMSDPDHPPTRMIVTTPFVPEDTPAYWLYDQAVMGVIDRAFFWADGTPWDGPCD